MNRQQLQATARFILDCEARRDSLGRLKVYPLPAGDGGGTFEVAGINDRYDHDIAHELRRLIIAKDYVIAENKALAYYIENTDSVNAWNIAHPALEAFLRDCVFNRGTAGAAKILQIALGVTADGKVGPKTRAALAKADVGELIKKLRAACETYERKIAPPIGARAKFWNGLVNRWNKREAFALALL